MVSQLGFVGGEDKEQSKGEKDMDQMKVLAHRKCRREQAMYGRQEDLHGWSEGAYRGIKR